MFLIFYSFRFFWKSCLHILKDIDICFVIIIIEYCAPHFLRYSKGGKPWLAGQHRGDMLRMSVILRVGHR